MNTDQQRQIHRMVATNCCCCRHPLSDAESTELGIGPICSRKFYSPSHIPSREDVETALGLLATSGLPDFVLDDFLKFSDKGDARKASNVLVYHASCHYDDQTEVFKCSNIVRALGYTQLANKLETDRTSASVTLTEGIIVAYLPSKAKMNPDFQRIPGCTMLVDPSDGEQAKQGHKFGWTFPADQEDYLMTVLGIYLGGSLMCGTRGIRTIPKKRWQDAYKFRYPQAPPTLVVAPPVVTPSAKDKGWIVDKGMWLEVSTPYHLEFKEELKNSVPFQERSWMGSYWSVKATNRTLVEDLIRRYFGEVL